MRLDCQNHIRKFKTEREKREHVIKLNLARRHLDKHEKGAAIKMLLQERGITRGLRGARPKGDNSERATELYAEIGVTPKGATEQMKADDNYQSFTKAEQKAIHDRKTTVGTALRP